MNALTYLEYDFCPIPVRERSKVPAVPWKKYIEERPTQGQVRDWFKNPYNLGIVCGAASKSLTVLDFDYIGRLHWNQFRRKLARPVANKLRVVVVTRKGVHVWIRSSRLEGNQVLARASGGQKIAETRGQGGYVLAPPSTHPSGTVYAFMHGSPGLVPTLTDPEMDHVLDTARSLNQYTEPESKLGSYTNGHANKVVQVDDVRAYLEATIKAIMMKVATEIEGDRNNTLFKSACRLGAFIPGGYISNVVAESLLLEAAHSAGLNNGILPTIRSGLKRGMREGIKLNPFDPLQEYLTN